MAITYILKLLCVYVSLDVIIDLQQPQCICFNSRQQFYILSFRYAPVVHFFKYIYIYLPCIFLNISLNPSSKMSTIQPFKSMICDGVRKKLLVFLFCIFGQQKCRLKDIMYAVEINTGSYIKIYL